MVAVEASGRWLQLCINHAHNRDILYPSQFLVSHKIGNQNKCLCLLQAVLEKFGAAEDPLLPGHQLLEQFQAQFVSALR